MAEHISLDGLRRTGAAVVHDLPAPTSGDNARYWELHPALFMMQAGCFVTFLGLLVGAASDSGLAVPATVMLVFMAMFFAVPAVLAAHAPAKRGKRVSWQRFLNEEMMTGSGKLTGRSAAIQILTVPVLLVGWAAFIAIYWSAIG